MSQNSNVVPTPIVDKNGKKTTVHKKVADVPKSNRASAAPVDAARAEAQHLIEEAIYERFPGRRHQDEMQKLSKGTAEAITSVPAVVGYKEVAAQTLALGKALGYPTAVWEDTVKRYKKFYSEFLPTTEVNYLELDDNDTNLPWADRYKIKMARMVAENGHAIRPDHDIYGSADDIYRLHFESYGDNCKVAEVTSLVEDEWTEFQDTFSDNSTHQGAQCEAQCSCGWFRGTIRAEGSLEDFIQQLQGQQLQGGIAISDVFDGSTNDQDRDRARAESRKNNR